ncbi:E3 ubiquitin-protein ligase Topors [Pseudolycoriella hygida]|uniref:E3 ubiquitin-protein ligase Topors n=1 Tax=Pseudolycoriella hygida TaxID=35572 RepID=A0A9Q0S345_9DIPT|nr:E3 ubiquitin-protein ligase Topors [Pseudolycoriella hygida]
MSDEALNCPPTPERMNNCQTPPNAKTRIRNFIQKQLMTDIAISDGEIDGEDNQRDSSSPPPNCSICLGQISSKCFTDSCLHTFCFSCLLEWSKIKPECPLCKQGFKSIIHNVKSIDKYEEYKVDSCRTNWASIANQFEQFLLATSFPSFRRRSHQQRGAEFNAIPSTERTATSTGASNNVNRMHQLFLNYNSLVERFAREYANDIIPLRSNGPAWRAYIYQRDLYALPLLDLSGRSRDISARFYRENPAQIHRLLGWLNREIIFLLNSTVHYNSFVLQSIEERITQCDLTSRAFRQHVQPFFTRHTSHFLHEFINFARSPFDIIGYDRNVQYRPHFYDMEMESVSIDSDRSDPSPRLSPRSDITAEETYTSNDSHTNSHNRSVIVFGSNSEGTSSRILATPSTHIFQPITEPVTVDTDDSDDCLFVCEQKPPHLRTPVMVELNSEEDSDVIIVETEIKVENCNTDQPTTSTGLRSRSLAPTTSHCHRDSTDSGETIKMSNKREVENPRRKRKRSINDEHSRGDGDGPSRIKMLIRSDSYAANTSTITTGAFLGDSKIPNTSMPQGNTSLDGSGPSTSVIRQPYKKAARKKKYSVYDASSESSCLNSTESTSSDSSQEDCKPIKQKRLTKKPSRKTVKVHKKHEFFTKKLQFKLKMRKMIRRLKEPKENTNRDDTSSMEDDQKESSSDSN